MLMHGELSAVKLEVAWCIILPVILAVSVKPNQWCYLNLPKNVCIVLRLSFVHPDPQN